MNQNLYYRGQRRPRRRSNRSQKRNLKYLVPFFLIAIVLLVLYLAFTGIRGLIAGQAAKLNNVGTVYIDTGKAQVLSFGETNYTSVLSGQKILEGDRLQVLKNSKVVVEFFDTTRLRLDEGSDLIIKKVSNSKNEEEVKLSLGAGQIWVNKIVGDKPKSVLEIKSSYQNLKVSQANFAVKSGLPEYLRVLEGEVFVEILESIEDKLNVLDSFTVGIGQEMLLTNQDYDMFKRRETPSVLGPIDTTFKITDWYKWNDSEDVNPTLYEVDPILKEGGSGQEIVSENPIDVIEDIEKEKAFDETKADAPKIVSPVEGAVETTGKIKISGVAPEGAEKIVVTSFEEDVPNPYILKGYVAGDKVWTYIAAYQNGDGNLVIGDNKFEVMAVNADGDESNVATLHFEFKPEEGTVVDVESLDAPEVVSVDGEIILDRMYTLEKDDALLQGIVGSWAKKVIVNGYELTEFIPFGNDWSYVLSEEMGTLKEGENVIKVQALDADGVKSPQAVVRINYVKEAE